MINELASHLFTIDLWVGVVVGYAGRYLICRWRAHWLDRHRPLPDGRHHRVPMLNRAWIGGLAALAAVAWSIYQVSATANRTDQVIEDARRFATQVQECQRQFNEALAVRSTVTAENEALSARDRAAQRDWIATLVAPPADINKLPPDDPARTAWAVGVTGAYQQRSAAIEAEREHNEQVRRAHPLPEPTCGK